MRQDALYCALPRAVFWPPRGRNALFGRKTVIFPIAYGSGQMYYTHLRAACDNFGSAHFRNTRPVTILHHRHIRRWPAISTAACFAIPLCGNCFRWERCPHAGGAVVQIYRKIFVCWPQCSSMGSFCGIAVQPDPHPASLFAHFFWQGRKSGSAKQRLRCHRTHGSSVQTDKRADVHPQGVGRIRSAPSSLTAALAIGLYRRI